MDKKFREALSEIYEILLYIDQKSFDEIPFEVIFKISENKSKEYDFKIDENEKELGEIIENKICDESRKLGYNNYSFMKSFSQIHFKWHCMILNTIISECESRKELKERYMQFFSEKSRFENRMGFDIYEDLHVEKTLSYSRFLHECVRNKKMHYALFLYEYSRFAQRMKRG